MFTWAKCVVVAYRVRGHYFRLIVSYRRLVLGQRPERLVMESSCLGKYSYIPGDPLVQGSGKGQAEKSRKAKKLTMFGCLGAYQCAGVRWGPRRRAEADAGAEQVRRGSPVHPSDPVWYNTVARFLGCTFSKPPGGREGKGWLAND